MKFKVRKIEFLIEFKIFEMEMNGKFEIIGKIKVLNEKYKYSRYAAIANINDLMSKCILNKIGDFFIFDVHKLLEIKPELITF